MKPPTKHFICPAAAAPRPFAHRTTATHLPAALAGQPLTLGQTDASPDRRGGGGGAAAVTGSPGPSGGSGVSFPDSPGKQVYPGRTPDTFSLGDAAPVPEPAAWLGGALLLFAGMVMGLRRRRRQD